MTTNHDGSPVSEASPGGLAMSVEPRTTRLNRRAAYVAAVVAVLVFGAMALTLSDASDRAIAQKQQARIAPATAGASQFWETGPDGVAGAGSQPDPIVLAAVPDVAEPEAEPERAEVMTPVFLAEGPPRPTAEEQREIERMRRAREAFPLVQGFRDAGGAESSSGATRPLTASASFTAQSTAGPHPDLLGALTGIHPPDPYAVQNNQEGKRAFLEDQTLGADDEINPHRVREPLSPYEITAGSILPAVLVTQANSDLPGMMTARIREPVYDSATGRHLLIPQGSTLIGAYDSVVSFGQERLLVAWQRILFPDGTKLNIESMPGADLMGAAGFRDRVNRHYLSLFGGALLMSVISAGAQLSQDIGGGAATAAGASESTRETVQNTLAAALGQNLTETSSELIRRHLNRQPTIEIRPGTRFVVMVQRDLVLPGPYVDHFAGVLP